MRRVLINLIENGIDASDKGGQITITTHTSCDIATLSITDTGPGVPDDVRRRLFEPFFTTRERGSGLGLAIVQKTAETNAGHVEVESEPGRGTTFRLVLPAVRAPAEEEEA